MGGGGGDPGWDLGEEQTDRHDRAPEGLTLPLAFRCHPGAPQIHPVHSEGAWGTLLKLASSPPHSL